VKSITDNRKEGKSGSISGDIGNMPNENWTVKINPSVLKTIREKARSEDANVSTWFDTGTTIELKKKEEEIEDIMELAKDTKLGTKLTNVTLKKVILIVLL